MQVSQQRMLKITEAFARGEITLPDFKLAMMQEVKSLNIATAISANGGLTQMDARRWGEVGARLRREYSYLNELGTKIANGHLSAQSGRLRTSARAYAASSQTLFWELTNRRMKETGNFVLARRVMGAVGTEHCSGCSSEASKDFMPLDEIAPIGSKECKWFCHCSIEYKVSSIARMAKDIAETHNKNGDSTFNMYEGDLLGQDYYSVSLYPEPQISTFEFGRNLDAKTIREFIDKHRDLLRDPRNSVGTWYEEKSDATYIDVVATLNDRKLAEELGRMYNQIAIFDLKRKEAIATGGTGTMPPNVPAINKRLSKKGGG